ncbi:MAG TPA: CHC2 zinc finger domain-containing protein [Ktedonobacteraceae bacterium]|nr:CHC2 zinc finger domain-containing protein [Ktedonobacteraceae bacterium]
MEPVAPELLAAYAALFVHCADQYAVQQRDGSYWRVQEPLSLSLLAAHLCGQWTLGTYLLDAQSTCRFAVFDADGEMGLEQLAALSCELAHSGIPSVLEASRRGGHLWVHLREPTPAALVRAWLVPSAVALGVELYPKQDMLAPGGSGSLIRLPLGVHRLSRGWYPFVAMDSSGNLVPVGETVAECCTWLCQQVQPVAVPVEVAVAGQTTAGKGPVESGEVRGSAPMASHGRYASIRAWCQAQDLVEVIGRYVVLDQRGLGSCPFKAHHSRGDVRPSFQVFGGPDPHWYCYTWQRAGNLFDFLCLYYEVSPQAMWRRIREEGW